MSQTRRTCASRKHLTQCSSSSPSLRAGLLNLRHCSSSATAAAGAVAGDALSAGLGDRRRAATDGSAAARMYVARQPPAWSVPGRSQLPVGLAAPSPSAQPRPPFSGCHPSAGMA